MFAGLGCGVTVLGIYVALKRGYWDERFSRYFDYGEWHGLIGISMAAAGILMVWIGLRRRRGKGERR